MKEILDKHDLAKILGISVKRIENTITRQQYEKLPPMMPRTTGQKRYWAGRVVEKWLQGQVELATHDAQPVAKTEGKRGRGRPRKA